MWRRVIKAASSLPILITAGVLGLYLIFGFFLVDPLAQKLLPWVGENKLASQLSAKKVSFNPLTLEATVEGLSLAEQNGAPLASFDRLYVNLGTTGLFRWAWRIQSIELDRPRGTLLVRPGGKLNWSALIDKLNEDKQPPSDTVARVLIERIRIADGDIEYTDANRPGKPFKISLQPLGIELDGLSTLPEDRGNYLIAAKLPEQGGTLKWKGSIGLNPLASSGELGLDGVRLTKLLRVIKTPRHFDIPSGTLAASLRYRFAMVRHPAGRPEQSGEDVPWLQVNGANVVLKELALAPRGNAVPVLQLAEARIDDANLDLVSRQIKVDGISLLGGKFAATRSLTGELDWQTLFASEPQDDTGHATAPVAANAAQQTAPAPWTLGVREIKLAEWSARYTDLGFAAPLRATAEWFGLNASMKAALGATTSLEVKLFNATTGPVRVLSGEKPIAELAHAGVSDATFSLPNSQLRVGGVELNGAKTTVSLDKDRVLNWSGILQKASGAPVAAPDQAKSNDEQSAAMDMQVSRLSIDGIEVAIEDQSTRTPVKLDLAQGFVILKDLSLDMTRSVPLEAGFSLKQGGRFKASGTLVPGTASGRVAINLSGLSLDPFAPYVNQFAKLQLRAGTVATRGNLVVGQGQSGMTLDYRAGFAVDDLAITEEETDEAFLGWKRLSSDSLRLSLGPDRLQINELVAQNPFGKVIIFEDKSVNLQRMMRTPASGEKPAAQAKAPSKVAAPARAPSPPARFPLAIERVRIFGANMEFADLSLTPQFGTRMHDLNGVITGLSTDSKVTAQVELDGRVDEFGSARVRGSIQPFQATEFTDLKLTFRNLEMVNMTPYSGKFAGRKVDSGKLSVDLEYKIKQRQLAGENKFVINKLKLGERVDSPDAMKLPLDLAIALLEDSNGIIDLDLPVSGSLDDPQFSYGKIVWKAVVNVLTKLVTAPFRALGNLLGISSDKLEAVEFDFGVSTLLPPEQEKLKDIGLALAKRPQLNLTIAPAYDVQGDTHAIQRSRIRRDVAQRMGLTVLLDQEAGPVDVSNPDTQDALEALYDERFKRQGGVRALKVELAQSNAAQSTGNATVPDPHALYAEMLARLTHQIVVTEADLIRLAASRGAAIQQALIHLGQTPPDKIRLGEVVKRTESGKLVESKLGLGVGKQGAASVPAVPPAAVSP